MKGAQVKLKSFLVVANVVIALLTVGIVVLQAIQDRARVEEKAFQSSENLVSVLAEHTRELFATIDLAMEDIARAVLATPYGEEGGAELTALLHERQSLTLGSEGYFVLDGDGRLLATSLPAVTEIPHPFELPEYRKHRDNPDAGLVLHSRRVRIGEGETWVVTVSHRITGSGGDFAGVVVAAMSMDYFLGLYDALWLGEAGSVSLFNGDGVMVVRHPFMAEYVGRDFGAESWMHDYVHAAEEGRILTLTRANGLRRYSTFKWVGDGDAVILVGLDERQTLASWYQRLVFASVISALSLVLLVTGSIGIATYFRRRTEWEEERSRRLRLIARESEALLAYQETAGSDEERVLQRVTEAARELIGAHQAVTRLVSVDEFAPPVSATSLSSRYREQGQRETGEGSELQRLVCENNRPLCLNGDDLKRHPLWPGAADAAGSAFPHGWLGVPLIASDGANLGIIQLADKYHGEFGGDDENELVQLASIASAIIESGRASRAREEALAAATAARQEVETIFASISDAVYAVDSDWRFVHLNPRAESLLERSQGELMGQLLWDAFPGTRGSLLDSELQRARRQQVTADFEFFYPPLASWFAVRAYPNGSGLTVYFQDITERVEAKERLRQVQKLDAIGQLTGGVAHDFNNLLTVIMGTSESLLTTLGKESEGAREQLQVILQASERGASLTHRLLAFARKQPLDPRTTDINRLMADSEDMLRRLLTEDIQIELVRGTGLWKAVVDPNELQNAILNLAINARDAMPDGGKLTIETANVAVDADYAAIHGISSGQFVMVAVSDTGEGIAPDTLGKVFEPFFTTKEVGKGSGLGLSMVYGFARQSGGHARIYSEPGEGTTVRLYLPRECDGEDAPTPLAGRARERFRGTESVLVVEDDELVRQHTQNSLGMLGYRVTACADGAAALALLDAGHRFDLLLTDVVLPGAMSGRHLADMVIAREPGMKVLYMSGYTENAIVHHGRLDRGVHLLGKPFRLEDLGRKVREVLES